MHQVDDRHETLPAPVLETNGCDVQLLPFQISDSSKPTATQNEVEAQEMLFKAPPG
jgi:hypothetical protein